MAKLKVVETQYGQTYGNYIYNKELGAGEYILKKVSRRKDYPDVLSRNRSEASILDAISNYKNELEDAIRSFPLTNGINHG